MNRLRVLAGRVFVGLADGYVAGFAVGVVVSVAAALLRG